MNKFARRKLTWDHFLSLHETQLIDTISQFYLHLSLKYHLLLKTYGDGPEVLHFVSYDLHIILVVFWCRLISAVLIGFILYTDDHSMITTNGNWRYLWEFRTETWLFFVFSKTSFTKKAYCEKNIDVMKKGIDVSPEVLDSHVPASPPEQ